MFYCIRYRKGEKRLNQLHKRLLRTNYAENLILACIQKTKAIPKESVRPQPDKSKSTNNNIAFITTYNPVIQILSNTQAL